MRKCSGWDEGRWEMGLWYGQIEMQRSTPDTKRKGTSTMKMRIRKRITIQSKSRSKIPWKRLFGRHQESYRY